MRIRFGLLTVSMLLFPGSLMGQVLPAPLAQFISLRRELPRTLVLIQEDDQPRVALREVVSCLRAAKFPLVNVDPALVDTVAAGPLLQAALAGDEQAALQLGRDLGAHVLVLGKAEWDNTLDNSTDKRETRTAQITLRAFRLDNGILVASAQGRGSAIDADGQRARSRAVRYAIHEIVQRSEFVGALANKSEAVLGSARR